MDETLGTCPACRGTGLVNLDESPRRLEGRMFTWAELQAKFKPCELCPLGERERIFWREMREKLG